MAVILRSGNIIKEKKGRPRKKCRIRHTSSQSILPCGNDFLLLGVFIKLIHIHLFVMGSTYFTLLLASNSKTRDDAVHPKVKQASTRSIWILWVCSYSQFDTFLGDETVHLSDETQNYHIIAWCKELRWLLVTNPGLWILSSSSSPSSSFKGLSNLEFTSIRLFDPLHTWSCWRICW